MSKHAKYSQKPREIVDESDFDEYKQDYAKTLICGHGKIGGYTKDESGKFIPTEAEWGSSTYGKYNDAGDLEVGSGKKRSLQNELDELVLNLGVEYWYSRYFALRSGYYYDKAGKIHNPTFGVGLRFAGYGFDAGFTLGEPGHPLTNTMRFSLNIEF